MRLLTLLAALLPLVGIVPQALALEIPPPPPRFVHDGAGLLDAAARRALEEKLLAIDRSGVAQVAVAIFPSLDGEALEDFTIRLVEAWKPGHGERDDGALIAVFVRDRKVRIEVGYGLEDRITDARAARIIRGLLAPAFRRGDFGGGLLAAADAVASLAAGGKLPPAAEQGPPAPVAIGFALAVGLMMILFIAAGAIASRAARSGRHVTARGLAGTDVPWWVWLLMSGTRHGHGGGPRGGLFGGGGGFGGGGSFGGGSFGGGGASGGW